MMNIITRKKVVAIAVASIFGGSLHAADSIPGSIVVSGEVTPKLFAFDFTKGVDANGTQFLERYNYQKGIGGDQRSGAYLDLDLYLVGTDGKRDVFVLERQGFGKFNHRNTLKANSDTLGLTGYFTNFRSSSGGVAFLYTPSQIPSGGVDLLYGAGTQTGFVRQFNNDSPGQTQFNVDRSTYGLGLALKPGMIDGDVSAAINYDGYKRDGNRYATYVLGNGDLTGANADKRPQRWRGFNAPVTENMNRYSFGLNGSPGGFNLAYEGVIEKFDNTANGFNLGDFNGAIVASAPAGVALVPGSLARPIQFAPDSTLISNNFRFAKNYGTTSVAAGYGVSVLDQDSFSLQQQSLSYQNGEITTNSAYLNVASNAIDQIGLEGFVKYNERKNKSDFPVAGLTSPTLVEGLDVRINRLEALDYGLSLTFRPGVLKSSATVGWKHEDKDRDLTWSQWGGGVVSIHPAQTLYREQTQSDELYVKWVARPAQGVILRVTPSYVESRQTGLVSEPETSLNLKTKISYTTSTGMQASGYYNYKNAKNANNAFSSSAAGGAFVDPVVTQDLDKTIQSAGVSLHLPISEWISTSASLSWMQDDFTSYFIRNGARRYDAPTAAITFAGIDRSNYNIDTYVLTLGGDWQVSDPLRLNAAYTWSESKGQTASGYVYEQLAAGNSIDGVVNSSVQSLTLGLEYQFSKEMKLKTSYAYDYFSDKAYTALSGTEHTLMAGVTIGF